MPTSKAFASQGPSLAHEGQAYLTRKQAAYMGSMPKPVKTRLNPTLTHALKLLKTARPGPNQTTIGGGPVDQRRELLSAPTSPSLSLL